MDSTKGMTSTSVSSASSMSSPSVAAAIILRRAAGISSWHFLVVALVGIFGLCNLSRKSGALSDVETRRRQVVIYHQRLLPDPEGKVGHGLHFQKYTFKINQISFVYNSSLSQDLSQFSSIFVNKLNLRKRRAQSLLQVDFAT